MVSEENTVNSEDLRQQAEKRLSQLADNNGTSPSFNPEEINSILNELHVHSIELEIQNDSLILAQEKLQKTRDRYADLFNSAPVGYLILNEKSSIKNANLSIANLLDCNKNQLIDDLFYSYIHNDYKDLFYLHLRDLFHKNKNNRCELLLISKTGKELFVIADSKKDEFDNNDKLCLVSIIDITQRKEAEEILKIARSKAEESDKLKTAFLANLSHEIRTPMNGIIGFAEILNDSDYNLKEKKKFADIIKTNGERLMDTINELINISKIEAGQLSLNQVETNINVQINDIVSFFKPQTDIKGLYLKSVLSIEDSKACILTDKTKLFEILSNLVKNAIKFTNSGGIEMGYTIRDETVEFFVKDTGKGIPEDYHTKIFERFVQGETDITRAYEGSGLGLAISKAYIEIMGGEIWLTSTLDKGTTFYFNIPYIPIHKNNTECSAQYENDTHEKILTDLVILIADDNEPVHIYLQEILKGCKSILTAKDGREAIEIVKEHDEINLILMDIKMPVLDGRVATQEIKKFRKDLKIIAQTAFALQGDEQKALDAGFDDYIAKPINKSKLYSLIHKHFCESKKD